jgi:multidrug efflux system membrane fusion protein
MLITARSAMSPSAIGRFLMFTLVLTCVVATSCSKGASPQQPPGTDPAPGGNARGGRVGRGGAGGGGPVPVVTAHSVAKPMPVTIPAVGTAVPLVTVQVRSQVTGQLSRVHFLEGQDVRKGDTLFSLDARPFEAALRQAEAVLARDTAQSKNAQSQQTRAKELFDRGLIPREQYETQNANASALEATLAADQSQVENARLSLQYATITAPVSGRTGALAVHQGDLLRANDTAPLVVINQVAPIYVSFSVPGRYLPAIRQNQARKPLRIEAHSQPGSAPGAPQTAPATPDSERPAVVVPGSDPSLGSLAEAGVVSFIDNTVDPTTGTIMLKGTFANADHALWPGLFVQVTLILSTDPSAVVVPAAAVQASQAGQYVFVVKADRTVELRNVRVDRQQGEEMVIAQGLAAGEEVVTDGHLRLTAGARVITGTRGQGPGGGRGGGGRDDSGREDNGGKGNGNGRRAGREGNQS